MDKDRCERVMSFSHVLYKWDIDYRLTAMENTGRLSSIARRKSPSTSTITLVN